MADTDVAYMRGLLYYYESQWIFAKVTGVTNSLAVQSQLVFGWSQIATLVTALDMVLILEGLPLH